MVLGKRNRELKEWGCGRTGKEGIGKGIIREGVEALIIEGGN